MKMINICLLAIVLALPIKISATPAQELYSALVPVQNNITILNGQLQKITSKTINQSSYAPRYPNANSTIKCQKTSTSVASKQMPAQITNLTLAQADKNLQQTACDLITAQQKAYAIAQNIVTNWNNTKGLRFKIQKPGLEPLDAPKLVPVTVNLANEKSTTLYYPVIPNWSYCNWPNDPNDPRQQLCLQGESQYPPTGVSVQIDYIFNVAYSQT